MRAITVKLFEREMVALSEWVYQTRYKEEGKDTDYSLMAPVIRSRRVSGLCAAEKHQDKNFATLTNEIDQALEGLCNAHIKEAEDNSSVRA